MINDLDSGQMIQQILSDDCNFTEFIDAFSNISNIYNPPNDKNLECVLEAKEFTKFAEDDINSAKILYTNKIYPTAIYHLQQSVEKLVKAYMIYYSILNHKNLKSVSHDSPKAFLKLIEKFQPALNPVLSIAEKFHTPNINIKKMSKTDIYTFEKLIDKSKKQIVKMEPDKIKKMVIVADEISNILNKQINYDDIKCKMLEVLSNLRAEFNDIEDSVEIKDENIEAIDIVETRIENFEIESFKDLYSYLPTLYILSIITYPHATFSRYPNDFEYDETLGIVQCFDEITTLLDKTIELWKTNAFS